MQVPEVFNITEVRAVKDGDVPTHKNDWVVPSLFQRMCVAFNVFIGKYDALDWEEHRTSNWSVRCPFCRELMSEKDVQSGRISFTDADIDKGTIILTCNDCNRTSTWIDSPGALIRVDPPRIRAGNDIPEYSV